MSEVNRSCEPMNKYQVRDEAGQGERADNRYAPVRGCGVNLAVVGEGLRAYPGSSRFVPEWATALLGTRRQQGPE